MTETVLHRRGTTLVRRLRLAPGEAMPWHRDPYHRVTVVLRGSALAIEYRNGAPSDRIELVAGQVDWDEPFDQVHRAVNVGEQSYEEVTVFFSTAPTRCRSRARRDSPPPPPPPAHLSLQPPAAESRSGGAQRNLTRRRPAADARDRMAPRNRC